MVVFVGRKKGVVCVFGSGEGCGGILRRVLLPKD